MPRQTSLAVPSSMSERRSSVGRSLFFKRTCLVVLLVGCAPHEPGPPDELPTSEPEVPAASALQVEVVDRAGFDSVLAEQEGKVVLVDFWATWCAPCVEQLPHTIEMAERGRSDGLVVVTVCMEDPDSLERIQKFLSSRGAAETINLVSSEGGGSRAMEAFEIAGGALPHYKLYDRSIELRHTFALDPSADKQFTSEDIEAAVGELLQE